MIHHETEGNITLLRLEHGKANALDVELLEALVEALDAVGSATPRGIVLTGTGSIFSAGVDLYRVVDGGREYLERFLPALTRGLWALLTFPRPVVAAINGHAVAGGAIVACACDHRVMARGDGRIGVPELPVGVPFPTLALEVLRAAVGRAATRLVLGGETHPADAAIDRGLVDEVVEPAELMPRALAVAEQYAAIAPETFRLTKEQIHRPLLERYEADAPRVEERILELWCRPETLDGIRTYLERLRKR